MSQLLSGKAGLDSVMGSSKGSTPCVVLGLAASMSPESVLKCRILGLSTMGYKSVLH